MDIFGCGGALGGMLGDGNASQKFIFKKKPFFSVYPPKNVYVS